MEKYIFDKLDVVREVLNEVIEHIEEGTRVKNLGNPEEALNFIISISKKNNVLKLASSELLNLQNDITEKEEVL
ncbi:MAG: hypothetical protein Q3988_01095 [Gemella sp.]|nr:hypothetical protein [Gemella sp.]